LQEACAAHRTKKAADKSGIKATRSEWIAGIGLDPHLFGTHSLRRTKATLIYRRTGNLRAVQLLLGHTKIESTVRYLGIEVDDALSIAEQVDL
jgi:integrase